MAWPVSQDYNEAIQNPKLNFQDAELKQGQPAFNRIGLPVVMSGNFADVYQFRMRCSQVQNAIANECVVHHHVCLREQPGGLQRE